ncbi:MAG: CAP domain-containing protein [Cyanothece sp. SIO1E1]|nr:CAP domain-containing protein [Cyanothece sp. SIO1E1]
MERSDVSLGIKVRSLRHLLLDDARLCMGWIWLGAIALTTGAWMTAETGAASINIQESAQVANVGSVELTSSHQPVLLARSRYEDELLRLTNIERRRVGLPPLRLSAQLNQVARLHAQDMVKNNFFSHVGSDGSRVSDRAKAIGYAFSYIGENLAAGNPSPAQTLRQWMNSPGHRANILNPDYREIGFGYVGNAATPYRHYWVQVFGRSFERRG